VKTAAKPPPRSKKGPVVTASGAPDLRSQRSERTQHLILTAAEDEFADKGNPIEAITKLVEFKFDYYAKNPATIRLLVSENMQSARYLKQSSRLREVQISLIDVLQSVLTAGETNKMIRPGVDPVQLYMSIAALSYFYFSNSATLSTAFGRNLASPEELKKRCAHAVELVLDHIRTR
jgi:AcrR family transcriptional regulator